MFLSKLVNCLYSRLKIRWQDLIIFFVNYCFFKELYVLTIIEFVNVFWVERLLKMITKNCGSLVCNTGSKTGWHWTNQRVYRLKAQIIPDVKDFGFEIIDRCNPFPFQPSFHDCPYYLNNVEVWRVWWPIIEEVDSQIIEGQI